MKAKIIMIVMVLTIMISQATLADITNEFILIGGDEYISVEAIKDLEVEVTIENGKVIIGEALSFDIEKECIEEDGRIFVPFKATLESVNIDFGYAANDKMKVEKGEKVYNIEIREKVEQVPPFYMLPIHENEKWEDKKDEHEVTMPTQPYDLKYVLFEDEHYINIKSLELLEMDVVMVEDDFIIKHQKSEKTHKLTIKDVNFGYELDNFVTRVPAKAILEALEISFEVAEDKLVIDLEGQHVVFHD